MSTEPPPEVRRSSIPYNDRSREMAWLIAHDEYDGEWVLLEGDRLLADADDPIAFREIAQAEGIEIPFIINVRKENGPYVGGG